MSLNMMASAEEVNLLTPDIALEGSKTNKKCKRKASNLGEP